MGALGALLAGGRLRALFRRSRRAGGQSGLEQLPRDGHRLRDRDRGVQFFVGAAEVEHTRGGNDLMSGTSERHEPVDEPGLAVARVMRNKSRRSFLVMGISAAAGLAGLKWLTTRPRVREVTYPLRRA